MLDQQRANFVALLVPQIFHVEIDVEPLAGPGDQPLAVVTLLARGVAGGEMGQAGHHRIFDFLLVVGGHRGPPDQRLERGRFQLADFGRVELLAELVLHPAAGGAHAEILGQELLPLRQIDLLDRLPGLGQQHFADLSLGPSLFRSRSRN